MNAESETDDRSGNGVVGPFSFVAANDNSECLSSFCGSHNLTILGSWFRRLNIHRWSWLSWVHHTKNEIDHIINRSTNRLLFKNYHVLRSAETPVNSDHLLVTVKAEILPLKKRHTSRLTKSYDVQRLLADPWLQQQYSVDVENRFSTLGTLPDDPEEFWQSVRSPGMAVH